jgi:hypothetical protein
MVDIPSVGKLRRGGLASHEPHVAYVRNWYLSAESNLLLKLPPDRVFTRYYIALRNFLCNRSSHISYAYALQTISECYAALRNGYKGLKNVNPWMKGRVHYGPATKKNTPAHGQYC